jgi:hypothetical protein
VTACSIPPHSPFLLFLLYSVPSISSAAATSASTATVVLGRPSSAGGPVLYTLTLESQWGSTTTTCPAAGPTLDNSVSCNVTTLLAGTTYSVSVTATDRSGVQSAPVTGSFITAPRWVLRLLLSTLLNMVIAHNRAARFFAGRHHHVRRLPCPLRHASL